MVNQEIRDLLQSLPAVAVVENDRPAFVIMTHEAWQQVNQGQPVRISSNRPGHLSPTGQGFADSQEAQILERLNKEILSLRNQIQVQEQAAKASNGGEGEVPADEPVDAPQ